MYPDIIRPFGRSESKALDIPLLMQTAGPADVSDRFVRNDIINDFCENSANDCVVSNYANGKHSLYEEIDSIRNEVVAEIHSFFQNHTSVIVRSIGVPPGSTADGEGCWRDRQCMSRICDAHFAFDIFGGTCVPRPTYLSGLPEYRAPWTAALLAT